ncbi:MAG: hypothetical protein IJ300_10055 [Clostridia bacterium]|nr:hypothetical protein [Clostridia bacterium]
MTNNIERQLEFIKSREHRKYRRELNDCELKKILPLIRNRELSYMRRKYIAA